SVPLPNCPGVGFCQAAGFSTKVVLGSKQWQFRSFVKRGTPGTRFWVLPNGAGVTLMGVWNVSVPTVGVALATGGLSGAPLAYCKNPPNCQSRTANDSTLLLLTFGSV